jgi:cytochrome c553
MHNSLNNSTFNTAAPKWIGTQFQSGAYLLQGETPTTACLNCHGAGSTTSGYHVSTENVTAGGTNYPQQFTPGGDFSWIKLTANSVGSKRGHNLTSTTFGYDFDSRLITSPGGNYPAITMGCTGCHNPHGTTRELSTGGFGSTGEPIVDSGSYGAVATNGQAVGAYRLLGGSGYKSKDGGSSAAFVNNPPTAVAPSSYNRIETSINTQVRVAYGRGMSEWCANCHEQIHLTSVYSSGVVGLKHPAGDNAQLGGTIAANYQTYVSSGNMSGSAANSFNSLVPFAENTADKAILSAQRATMNGPAASSTVNCLACHRAHAAGFDSMLRYDISDALVTDGAGVFEPRTGRTTTELVNAYYGRTDSTGTQFETSFKPAQRILCNKCHAKD